MRILATAFLVLTGIVIASSASAVDFGQKATVPQGSYNFALVTVLVCDNGNPASAWYQDDTGRYGNVFNFGGGMRVSAVEFAHYGFGFPGPYSYDIELWDLASCTPIVTVNNLVAQDAANEIMLEYVDLCPREIVVSGDVIVAIDANTCINPTDCYPDVVFDTQLNVRCPYIIDASTGVCYDVSAEGGPFILRVETDNCPVGTHPSTWGAVKQIYR